MFPKVVSGFLLLALAIAISFPGFIPTGADVKLTATSSSPGTTENSLTHRVQTQATETPQRRFGKLEVVVGTDQKKYPPGQLVHISILVTNHGTDPVTLRFGSTCHSSFKIEATNGTLLFAPFSIACVIMLNQLIISPGKTVEMGSFTWNQVIWGGGLSPEGVYVIRGDILSAPSVPAFSRIRICSPDHQS